MRATPVFGLMTLVSGCMMWDAGYTTNNPPRRFSVDPLERVPITYSVAVSLERGDLFGAPTIKSISEKIENSLRESGMFSEVSQADATGKNGYHIAVTYRQSGMTVEQAMGVAFLAGYTLLLVPTGEVLTYDGTATLYLKGKPIFSTAKAEEARCLIWLPMAPIGLFMNVWSVSHCIEKGTANALVSDILDEHKRRFLRAESVREIIEE